MMKKRIIGALALLITAMSLLPIYSVKANVLQVSVDNIYLTAGEVNSIKVLLKNIGELDIYTVEALLTSQVPGISVIKETQKVYDEIPKGKSKTYYPVLFVDQSIPLGTYTLTLTVKYIRYGEVFDSFITVPVGLVVSNESRPKLLYVSGQETVNAKTGTESELLYVFENDWDMDIRGLELKITSSTSQIIITGGAVTQFDSVVPSEQVGLTPTVSVLKSASLGAYTLTARATYEDPYGNTYYQNYVLPVNLDAKAVTENTIITIMSMEVSQMVRPGDDFTIMATVLCEGANAFDVISSISLVSSPKIVPLSPTRASVGDLSSGESRAVTWRLQAAGDIPAGLYPIGIQVTYLDNKGVTGQILETMTINVEGLIEFDLLDAPSITVKKGETAELEADLLLIGTDSVQFVSIELESDDIFKRVQGSTEYIGAVDPDSPIPFSIRYRTVEDSPEGDQAMNLKVSYRDHLNKGHEVGLSLDVTISGSAGDDSQVTEAPPLWIWIRRLLGLGP
jgi:hypothetical protein